MTGIGYKWGNTEYFCTSKMIEEFDGYVIYNIEKYANDKFKKVQEKLVFKNYML